MITNNVLNRVFHIKYGAGFGTSFTIDIDEKQYLITARHVVEGYTGGPIEIFHEKAWKKLDCTVVGVGAGNVDVAVLAPPVQLSPTHPLPANMGGIVLSQQIYFLGFPCNLRQDVDHVLNNDFPMPLVKSGVVSAVNFEGSDPYLILDGHNNPGFSGGPVVFVPSGNQPIDFHVAGIVSGYPSPPEPVYVRSDEETEYYIKSNPGIVFAWSIISARSLIENNPVGFALSSA